MSKLVYALLLPLFLSLSLGNAIANEPVPGSCGDNELFVNLTTDETWRSSMALNFSLRNLELRPVTIFLNVEGVRLAVDENVLPHDTYGLTGKKPNEVLSDLISRGATVIVCPNCLKRAGFLPEQLIQGTYLGGSIPQRLACSTTQLSY